MVGWDPQVPSLDAGDRNGMVFLRKIGTMEGSLLLRGAPRVSYISSAVVLKVSRASDTHRRAC